ncbi:MAG: MMPL family transporter [Solirubrobacteraceae bacterium]
MTDSAVGVTGRLAQRAAARPKSTIGAWLAAVVLSLVLVGTTLQGLSSSAHAVGSPGSAKAADAIARAFPAQSAQAATDVVIVSSRRDETGSPAFAAEVAALVARLRAEPNVDTVTSYLNGFPGLISADRHTTLIRLSVATDAAIKPVVGIVQQIGRDSAFSTAITGTHTADNDFDTLSQHDLEHAELAFGLPAALVVLVLVFGSLVAGLVPVLLAILSILVAFGIVALLSLEFSLSVFVVNMVTGMGLALGIDYSLFVVSRFREERTLGLQKEQAIARAGATASRAVLFSGGTFVVAMFGILLVPTTIMRSLAVGAIVVGAVSVTAALTLLPALLSVIGDRVNALRVPLLGRNLGRVDSVESRFWRRIVAGVLRRPGLSLTVSVAAMLAAAAPLLGLHIGASGVSSLPNSMPSKQGYVLLAREFPLQNPNPVQIVAEGGGPAVGADLVSLDRRLGSDPRFGPGAIATAPAAHVALLSVPVRGNPVAGPAIRAVRDLRSRVIPATFAGSGARVYVGGTTAMNADYFDAVTKPTPFVLAFVLGLSFIVLMIAFRSLVVALVSIALNLLSVGAAYGLLTLVFLHGVGAGLFGFERVTVIEAWVPLFLFSVLFGLSMDYQVFLMSRIRERYDREGSTSDAVAHGVASTARIITGAALIIVVVFVGFARGQLVMFQQMGFGVAVALLLDATVIRSVVLPSLLTLLGERSWYLPRWLAWLPELEIDSEAAAGSRPARQPSPERPASPTGARAFAPQQSSAPTGGDLPTLSP